MDNYNIYEIEGYFENWITDLGYRLDKKTGWKTKGDLVQRRLLSGDDKGANTSAIASLHTDFPNNGYIKDFKCCELKKWSFLHDYLEGHAPEKIALYKAAAPDPETAARLKARQEAKDAEDQHIAVKAAQEEYAAAKPADTHPYLDNKNVKAAAGVKVNIDGELLIPAYILPDVDNIATYQRIQKDGRKAFKAVAHTSGVIFPIGDFTDAQTIGIAEGYATAATINELTGLPVASCFSCNIMPDAAQLLGKTYPGKQFFIFADNDIVTATKHPEIGNPGAKGAEEATARLSKYTDKNNIHIITPADDFALQGKDCSDWNDYARENGKDTAKHILIDSIERAGLTAAQLAAAKGFDRLQPPTLERIAAKAQAHDEGLDIGLKMYSRAGDPVPVTFSGLTLLAARTGGGKTLMIANIVARILATNKDLRPLIISLEEAEDSIYTRILSAYIEATQPEEKITTKELTEAIRSGVKWRDYFNGQPDFKAQAERRRHIWEDVIFPAAGTIEQRLIIADLADVPELAIADRVLHYTEEAHRRYGNNALIFIDYMQKLKPADNNQAGYKEFKAVMETLQPAIAKGWNIFAAAQLNRTIATDAKAAKDKEATEFYTAYPEQIREAADIEQAADMIIYCKIDRRDALQPCLNWRYLKNRRGDPDAAGAFAFSGAYGFLDFEQPLKPTFRNTEDPAAYGISTGAAIQETAGETVRKPKPLLRAQAHKGHK